jgi:hypothetical protein
MDIPRHPDSFLPVFGQKHLKPMMFEDQAVDRLAMDVNPRPGESLASGGSLRSRFYGGSANARSAVRVLGPAVSGEWREGR